MGDDELKKELQRSHSHSHKAHSQALRIFDRRVDDRDALAAASRREEQLFFDRKARHRIGHEEKARERLKNSPLTTNLVSRDSKVLRLQRSDERRQQLQQEAAAAQRQEEWDARFRTKQAEKHREWELKKLQAEKRDHLEGEFVLKAQLDAAWSDRDLEHRTSPKRCLKDLQHTFFHGDAFVGPMRGSIRPSKGKFVGSGPQSIPPRFRTYATSLPELREMRPQSLPSLGAPTRSPGSKASMARSPSSAKSALARKSTAASSKTLAPSASESDAQPPAFDPKPPSPSGEPPGQTTADPPPSEASPLECTQLPDQRSNVYVNAQVEGSAHLEDEVVADIDGTDAGTEDSPSSSAVALARTCSGPAWDMEVTFESAAGHGLAAKSAVEGSPVTLGLDRGAFRLRREGDLLTFESPQGGLYVGLDASGAPLLVRTGAEACAKRGVFREVPAANGAEAPWVSLEDAGMPGRYLEADGAEDDPNNFTWKLVPCS